MECKVLLKSHITKMRMILQQEILSSRIWNLLFFSFCKSGSFDQSIFNSHDDLFTDHRSFLRSNIVALVINHLYLKCSAYLADVFFELCTSSSALMNISFPD
jgi:hypothetical protein